MQNVLIVGARGSGRTHAMAWKLRQSPECGKIYLAPGNTGAEFIGTAYNLPFHCSVHELTKLAAWACENKIGLTIFTDDLSIALGGADIFRQNGLRAFGSSQRAAEIEWSKTFGHNCAERSGSPRPRRTMLRNIRAWREICLAVGEAFPYVVKADGLMEGKGSYPCFDEVDVAQALAQIKRAARAEAVHLVVEEFLVGYEASFHALVDTKGTVRMLKDAQDKKKLAPAKKSPMTGGIGMITPLPLSWPSAGKVDIVRETIVEPTVKLLAARGRPFGPGCLYPGTIVTKEGVKLIEYNARYGDPELQALLLLLKSDLLELHNACVDGWLDRYKLEWHEGSVVGAVACSRGYPKFHTIGQQIRGLARAASFADVQVFHAGMKENEHGFETAGGRVLGVFARDANNYKAASRCYAALQEIYFDGMYFRRDAAMLEHTI